MRALLWLSAAVASSHGAVLTSRLGGTRAAAPLRRMSGPVVLQLPEGDHIVGAMSADGSISARAIVTTDLVSEATELQGLGKVAAAALGRALTCSLLLSEGLKDDESFQVKFNGDGPLRGVLATANGKLESRGYVGNPNVSLPLNPLGKIDVGGGVGKGALQVVRTKQLPGETLPSQYSSITEIISGEIPEDINHYLLESEQREGGLAAGVFVKGGDGDGSGGVSTATIDAAGGWSVQLLPFAAEESVELLTRNLQQPNLSPTEMIRSGLGPTEMLEKLLEGLEPQFSEARKPVGLAASCPCSEERVMRTLSLLPASEIKDIIQKREVVEAKCEFCGTVYRKTSEQVAEELAARIEAAKESQE